MHKKELVYIIVVGVIALTIVFYGNLAGMAVRGAQSRNFAAAQAPTFSTSDVTFICNGGEEGGDLCIGNIATNTSVLYLARGENEFSWPDWSPDGKLIAFLVYDQRVDKNGEQADYYAIQTIDKNKKVVKLCDMKCIDDACHVSRPVWSANRAKIMFKYSNYEYDFDGVNYTNCVITHRLVDLDVKTKQMNILYEVTQSDALCQNTDVAPYSGNGCMYYPIARSAKNEIVAQRYCRYVNPQNNKRDVVILNADLSVKQIMLNSIPFDFDADWSCDSKEILYYNFNDLYFYDAKTGKSNLYYSPGSILGLSLYQLKSNQPKNVIYGAEQFVHNDYYVIKTDGNQKWLYLKGHMPEYKVGSWPCEAEQFLKPAV